MTALGRVYRIAWKVGIVIKTEKSLGHDFKERTCAKESKNNYQR